MTINAATHQQVLAHIASAIRDRAMGRAARPMNPAEADEYFADAAHAAFDAGALCGGADVDAHELLCECPDLIPSFEAGRLFALESDDADERLYH